LKYVLAFGLLGYVVYANWAPANGRGLGDVWQAHVIERQPVDGNALLLAFLLYASGLLVTLYRWHILMRAQNLPITGRTTLRIGLLGFFFNTFLPGSVGGDLVKAAAVAREQSRRAVAVATVIMDRAIGLWSMVAFVALLGGAYWLAGLLDDSAASRAKGIVMAAIIIVGISLAVWVLMSLVIRKGGDSVGHRLRRVPRIGNLAAEFWHVARMYRSRQGSIALAIGLSWLSDLVFAVAYYCCGLTLWDGLPNNPLPTLAQHLLIVPVSSVIAAIPLFPGGAGINEAGFGGLYALFGSTASNGILTALVGRFLSWVIGFLGYLASQGMQSNPKEAASTAKAPIAAKPIEEMPATIDVLS
jgi:uncharacterized protein (TIRG00374 family)